MVPAGHTERPRSIRPAWPGNHPGAVPESLLSV